MYSSVSIAFPYLLKNQKNSFSVTWAPILVCQMRSATASPLWQDISFSIEYMEDPFPSHWGDFSPGGRDTRFHYDAIYCFSGCAVCEKMRLYQMEPNFLSSGPLRQTSWWRELVQRNFACLVASKHHYRTFFKKGFCSWYSSEKVIAVVCNDTYAIFFQSLPPLCQSCFLFLSIGFSLFDSARVCRGADFNSVIAYCQNSLAMVFLWL